MHDAFMNWIELVRPKNHPLGEPASDRVSTLEGDEGSRMIAPRVSDPTAGVAWENMVAWCWADLAFTEAIAIAVQSWNWTWHLTLVDSMVCWSNFLPKQPWGQQCWMSTMSTGAFLTYHLGISSLLACCNVLSIISLYCSRHLMSMGMESLDWYIVSKPQWLSCRCGYKAFKIETISIQRNPAYLGAANSCLIRLRNISRNIS